MAFSAPRRDVGIRAKLISNRGWMRKVPRRLTIEPLGKQLLRGIVLSTPSGRALGSSEELDISVGTGVSWISSDSGDVPRLDQSSEVHRRRDLV